jgi:hypothetical protein
MERYEPSGGFSPAPVRSIVRGRPSTQAAGVVSEYPAIQSECACRTSDARLHYAVIGCSRSSKHGP